MRNILIDQIPNNLTRQALLKNKGFRIVNIREKVITDKIEKGDQFLSYVKKNTAKLLSNRWDVQVPFGDLNDLEIQYRDVIYVINADQNMI